MNPLKCNQREASNFRHIVLNIPTKDSANYHEIFQVDPQHLPQALRLAKTFQDAISPNDLSFNFEKALEIAKNIPNSGIVSSTNQNIIKQYVQLSSVIDQIKESIKTMLGLNVSSSNFWRAVAAAITNVFTNLNTQEGDTWIFWETEDSSHTRYYYNILLTIQNAETGGVMAVLPIAFEISVNVCKEKLLLLTVRDSASYEVNMKSLTLVQSLDSKNELNVNIRKPLKGHRSPYLLDWEGNPVMFNKSYYLDPYAYLRRGLAYETYLGEEFVLLQNEGSTGYGQPIKFTRFIEDHTSECINIGDWVIIKAVYPSGEIDKDYFTYSQTPFVPGVKLSGLPIVPHHPDESQIWIPEILPEELPEDINSAPDLLNFFTIKNKYTRGYLSYEITPGKSWLNAKTDNIQKETLWRLIPE